MHEALEQSQPMHSARGKAEFNATWQNYCERYGLTNCYSQKLANHKTIVMWNTGTFFPKADHNARLASGATMQDALTHALEEELICLKDITKKFNLGNFDCDKPRDHMGECGLEGIDYVLP